MLHQRYKLYYLNQIKRDFISKTLSIKNVNEIPKINQVALNIDFLKNISSSNILKSLLFFFLVSSGQVGKLNHSKYKSKPIGCNLVLKGKHALDFLEKLFSLNILKSRNYDFLPKNSLNEHNSFSFLIRDLSIFFEIEEDFDKFMNLGNLKVSIGLNRKSRSNNLILLNLYQIIN